MRKEVITYFLGKLIPAGVNLAVIILAIRVLGNAEYGKYSLVFYAAMLLNTLTFGWIQQGILRFLTAYGEERAEAADRFFYLSVISGLAAVVPGVLISLFYFLMSWQETAVLALFLFVYNLFLFFLTLNQAEGRSTRYVMLENSYSLLFLMIFLLQVTLFQRQSFILLFEAMTAALVVTGIVRYLVLPKARDRMAFLRFRFDAGFTRKVFAFGFPITLWLFIANLWNFNDRFIIKEYLDYGEAGVYSAVKDLIFKIATFSTTPVILAFHPGIAERWNQDRKPEAMKLIRLGTVYCLLVMMVLGSVFLVFRNLIFQRILHLGVEQDLLVSAALLLSAFLWQTALLVHKPLELLLKPGLMVAALGVASGINIGANILLVPVYGYTASAVVSLLSVLFYLAAVLMIITHYRRKGSLPGVKPV